MNQPLYDEQCLNDKSAAATDISSNEKLNVQRKDERLLHIFLRRWKFGGNLWNSYPYLAWKNSKFETETSKLGGTRRPF